MWRQGFEVCFLHTQNVAVRFLSQFAEGRPFYWVVEAFSVYRQELDSHFEFRGAVTESPKISKMLD